MRWKLASCLSLGVLPVLFIQCSPDTVVPPANDAQVADRGAPEAGASVPLIIGHRGAPGYRPEHTLASYQLAIDLGADFIEPDLVPTRDGHLVARHENDITDTTDVASHPEFAHLKKSKSIDEATAKEGWYTEDFTLEQLKTLRARERLPDIRPLNTAYDGIETIPTLQEVIDLAKRNNVGIYPETKHPTYFQGLGLAMEEKLVEALHAAGWTEASAPVFIQSFETANLRKLRTLTKLRLVQLVDADGSQPYDLKVAGDPRKSADLVKPDGLAWIATYANGLGPYKNWIVPRDASNKLLAPTQLVADAHRHGLVVHTWTFRNENNWLPADFQGGSPDSSVYKQQRGNAPAEYQLFLGLGIDGLFSDQPDTARAVRDEFFSR